jgi:acyl carrier protein
MAVDARDAIVRELGARGFTLSGDEHEVDLISAGVNSATLIQALSALEEVFDVDLDTERLFSARVTVTRLEAEITRALASP